jgi:hypothetical protein
MNWQLLAVVGIIIAAAGYLLRRSWLTWRGSKGGCGGGCGCAKTAETNGSATLIPLEQLTLRRR